MRNTKTKVNGRSNRLTKINADPFALYEASVQDTETTIDFINKAYGKERGRLPLSLREDFCGTARLAADWVGSDSRRTAVGLDIDTVTLDWAKEHNVKPLGERATRIDLVVRDVLEGTRRRFDVVAAFNFSYWIFQQRETLTKYFKGAMEGLNGDGVFLLDLHGGPDAQYELEEETDLGDFVYVWEQEKFDPINNRAQCHIHFKFEDGSALQRAFSYDWRIWSIPELRDILKDAGFSKVDTWWDGDDDQFTLQKKAENHVSWLAYLAAWR